MTHQSPPIRCRDLTVGYDGEPVLESLSFTVEKNATLALVGQSGSGKTTLVKSLAGVLEPIDGEATVLGTTLPRSPPSGSLGYIPQDLGLVMHGTVLRNVLCGTLSGLGPIRSLLGRFPPDAEDTAREAIESVGLVGMEGRRVSTLSGGQQRRVAIARALVQKPRVLLADEILSDLDTKTAESIVECIESLQAETGMSVVIVEHDLALARSIADQLLHVEDGGVRYSIGSSASRSTDVPRGGLASSP